MSGAYRVPDERALILAQELEKKRLALIERARRLQQRQAGSPSLWQRVKATPGLLAMTTAPLLVLAMVLGVSLPETVTLFAVILGGLALAKRMKRRKALNTAERRAASLPFLVPGFLASACASGRLRATVALAREPDEDSVHTVTALAKAMAEPTEVERRGHEMTFTRRPFSVTTPGSDWCRALVDDVLEPLHEVLPIESASFEKLDL